MMMLKMMTMMMTMMIMIIIDHNDETLKNGEWKPFIISDPWLSKEGARPNVSPLTVHCNDDDDDGDDIYIMVKCLSVCQQKSLFLYSKDLVISPVYRHLSLFKSVWKPKKRQHPLKKSFYFKGFGFFSCL